MVAPPTLETQDQEEKRTPVVSVSMVFSLASNSSVVISAAEMIHIPNRDIALPSYASYHNEAVGLRNNPSPSSSTFLRAGIMCFSSSILSRGNNLL